MFKIFHCPFILFAKIAKIEKNYQSPVDFYLCLKSSSLIASRNKNLQRQRQTLAIRSVTLFMTLKMRLSSHLWLFPRPVWLEAHHNSNPFSGVGNCNSWNTYIANCNNNKVTITIHQLVFVLLGLVNMIDNVWAMPHNQAIQKNGQSSSPCRSTSSLWPLWLLLYGRYVN